MRKYKNYIHLKGKNIPIGDTVGEVLLLPEDAFRWSKRKIKPMKKSKMKKFLLFLADKV